MTKKDYIAIANAIKDTKYQVNAGGDIDGGLNLLIEKLATIFKIDNHNFDRLRFFSYIEDKTKRYKDFTDR